MTDLHPRDERTAAAKGVLYLQFRIGQQRFALDVREVIEVLPRRPLKPIPGPRPGSPAFWPTAVSWCR